MRDVIKNGYRNLKKNDAAKKDLELGRDLI